jgi:hypothetical protein
MRQLGATRAAGAHDLVRAMQGLAAQGAGHLSDPRHLPLCGKPRAGQFALGALAIDRQAGPGRVHFLSGPDVPIQALAERIVADWPEGYLYQEAAAALRRHSGAAMALIRIVTLWTDRGGRALGRGDSPARNDCDA